MLLGFDRQIAEAGRARRSGHGRGLGVGEVAPIELPQQLSTSVTAAGLDVLFELHSFSPPASAHAQPGAAIRPPPAIPRRASAAALSLSTVAATDAW